MNIDIDTVRRVARLSRLSLADGELDGYCVQIGLILSYISKLKEVDTDNIAPTSHPLSTLKNVYRKDTPKPSLNTAEALQNAPLKEGGFFKVPQVIEKR